ncbi:MAG: family aminopeptidase [Fibrobacteres bacterium]|nr:family aminopeptidase [Fibrobacterota bacterium]
MSRNAHADALIAFLNASPTPFHAVQTAADRLSALGAVQLDEKDAWSLKPGQTAFVTRNGSSLVAFRLPADVSRPKFRIAAAHTDSPCLKLKPRSPEPSANYRQWGVEVYGGVLYNSWLDRDLGVAGRVTRMDGGAIRSSLVRNEGKPFRIPQLAIHLDRGVNESGLILNAQRHLQPVLGLVGSGGQGPGGQGPGGQGPLGALAGGRTLEGWLEETLGAPFGSLTFELHLYDTSPAGYGGFDDEFIFSGRLDNLAMSHAALEAFCAEGAGPGSASGAAGTIQVAALFDNEEVGSTSAQGANSNLIQAVLERCLLALGRTREEIMAAMARSHIVSADMAHAIHPNYPEKHEPYHYPLINHGPVIKANASMRYATNAETSALFRGLCAKAAVPFQDFVNRTDLACGTTIGPHVAAALGIPTVDVGNPMLSMHSAREMCGSEDHGMMIRTLREFFRE